MNIIEDFVREFERKYPGFIDNAQRYVNNWFSKVKNTVLSEKEQEIVERYRHPEMVKASDLMPQGGIKSTGSKRQNSKKKVKGTGVLVPNYPSFESWEQMVKLFPFIVKGWLQDGTIKPGDPIHVYLTKLPRPISPPISKSITDPTSLTAIRLPISDPPPLPWNTRFPLLPIPMSSSRT